MEKYLAWKGKNINYTVQGTGPAVVLLHGFPVNLHVWDKFVEFLSPHFKTIAIDLPGFGKSSVYDSVHTMSFMAEAVKAVLEGENISKAILVGHSMGGYVSLAFAKLFPENLAGIVLFHSHAAADQPEARANRIRTLEAVQNNHKDFILKFIPSLFAQENVSRCSQEIEDLKQLGYQSSAEAIIAALRGMAEREDFHELLKTIDVPVFFVVGKEDPRASLPELAHQMSLPKNCEGIILGNVGHTGYIEAPEKIFPAIESFCERTYQENSPA
ncbi:MAG: alpha/beta hydrolase [Bacteroidales bacterium]|nr:alpha/beta hydrolase [Bacteroidales bacterium]